MRDWVDFTTLGIAVFGAALSIYNTWNANAQNRTRILAEVGIMNLQDGRKFFAVEVINRSAFDVSIDEIALSTPRGRGTRFAFIPPYIDGSNMPTVIAARSSKTFSIAPWGAQQAALAQSKWLLVKTSDGQLFKSSSPSIANND